MRKVLVLTSQDRTMSRYWSVALLLAFVPACAKPTTEAPQPPAVVIATDPSDAIVYDAVAPAPREVPLAAEPSDAKDAIELFVVGDVNGVWKVQYASGQRLVLDGQPEKLTDEERKTCGRLVLPAGRPVKFTVTATGGVAFEIPRLAVVAGAAVKPTRVGEFAIRSGSTHVGTAIVVPAKEFEDWLLGFGTLQSRANPVDGSLAHQGRQLFLKLQCIRCHSATPDAKGPVLEGLYGTRVALKGGGAELADDEYIRESIRKPKAKVVEGWEAIMPAYDETKATAEELNALVAYIRSLKPGDLNRKEERFPAPVGAPTERPKEPPPPPKLLTLSSR